MVQTCVVPEAAQPFPFLPFAVKVYVTVAPSGRLIGLEKASMAVRPKPGLAGAWRPEQAPVPGE